MQARNSSFSGERKGNGARCSARTQNDHGRTAHRSVSLLQGTERASGIRVDAEQFPILRDDRIDRADVSRRGFNFVQKRENSNLVRNGHARAAKITKSAKALDGVTNGLNLPGQIDEVEPQFLERCVMDGRREGMLDWVSDDPAELCRRVDVHRALIPWKWSFLRRS